MRLRRYGLPACIAAADDGILYGNYARIGTAVFDSAHGGRESGDRNDFHRMPPYLGDGELGVSSTIALKSDAHRNGVSIRWPVPIGRRDPFTVSFRTRHS